MTPYLGCILLDARVSGSHLPRQLAALEGLNRQRDPTFGILLVDDTADQRRASLAARHGVQHLVLAPAALGTRLNIATSHCQSDVLVFPAARQQPDPASISKAAARVAEKRQDAMSLTTSPSGPLARWLPRLVRGDLNHTLCVSREWFERIGGCDPELEHSALTELLERLRACGARVVESSLNHKAGTVEL
ncbi:hypothetical protein [Halomonas urumqiensis]|uniref:Glycosyltransferase n=1 Tax=Halomonas urumqiensis TaxID=1684789 RepID=A0A2N7UKJ1_9GAMM|nr:hypothetical protein [Halomonas urumqiensis]PMR80922.1 hypothetical protein C1H70_07670 [Halomonas urumqiensis]PTB02880.1 hypothetical protein C6V82_09670 [Halomonas urumqiensis]